ncbi:hypothetical protein F511_09941 [Dorcoceras hygrometricum]|uniref:Uncharacterized protein n=1 Tax=Dorcoceras hygrometricum TaxID=472368 RepID=A0A2Z7DCR3_9LAMI|nr:hypothetical protein F511_09941 [Dorcoceras hygrometricum]
MKIVRGARPRTAATGAALPCAIAWRTAPTSAQKFVHGAAVQCLGHRAERQAERRYQRRNIARPAATSAGNCATLAATVRETSTPLRPSITQPLREKAAIAHPSLGSDTTVGEPWRIRITAPARQRKNKNLAGRRSIQFINIQAMTICRVFLGVTLLATRAWLRPLSRGNRHFTVGGGRLRQSGQRPEGRLLRQPALEGLTRSARTDSPCQVGRNKFRRSEAAAAFGRGGRRRLPH